MTTLQKAYLKMIRSKLSELQTQLSPLTEDFQKIDDMIYQIEIMLEIRQ